MNTNIIVYFIKFLIIFSTISYGSWLFSYSYDHYILSNYDKFDTYIKVNNIAEYQTHSNVGQQRTFLQTPLDYKFSDYIKNNRFYAVPESFLTFYNISYPKPIIILQAITILVPACLFHPFLFCFTIVFLILLYLRLLILNYINELILAFSLMIFSIISFYNSKKIKSE